MRVLLLDTLVTAPYVMPLAEGWVAGENDFTIAEALDASAVGPGDAALLALPDAASLWETHRLVPEVGVVANGGGAIALRTPVRPDEIEQTDVVLYETDSASEVLARATLWPFYGISTSGWRREPGPGAQAVVVQGVEALTPLESGYSSDLARAWYVLTGASLVTHILGVPIDCSDAEVVSVVAEMVAFRNVADEHRREGRTLLVERHGVDRGALIELDAQLRFALDDEDRRSAQDLMVRGTRNSRFSDLPPITWILS